MLRLLCLINVRKKIFNMGVVRCFCFGLQKYEKSSVDGVVEVLHSAAVAQEEIEHQCAALESTPTLTEFTEAMIKGRSLPTPVLVLYNSVLLHFSGPFRSG